MKLFLHQTQIENSKFLYKRPGAGKVGKPSAAMLAKFRKSKENRERQERLAAAKLAKEKLKLAQNITACKKGEVCKESANQRELLKAFVGKNTEKQVASLDKKKNPHKKPKLTKKSVRKAKRKTRREPLYTDPKKRPRIKEKNKDISTLSQVASIFRSNDELDFALNNTPAQAADMGFGTMPV